MTSVLAMRVACVLYALAPHLIPISPERATTEVLARGANEAWLRAFPAVRDALYRNAAA